MDIKNYLEKKEWELVSQINLPERAGEFCSHTDLKLSNHSKKYLQSFKDGIFRHQQKGIVEYLNGNNICLSTTTASGKSAVFYVSAIEAINKDSEAKILAIYPLKALGNEQETKWKEAFKSAGLNCKVGRIDGGIHVSQRSNIFHESQVLVMTPDVIHAWLLSQLNTKNIIRSLSKIKLIIIDEAHTYSGVFGSNSAFLFRRLNHIINKLNGTVKYIAASATIKNPEKHLRDLVGLDFFVIDSTFESSPKKQNTILLVEPPKSGDVLSNFSELLTHIAKKSNDIFLCFVDSRKQTEQMASISARSLKNEENDEDDLADEIVDNEFIKDLQILPYRAGYEEEDRKQIQNKLTAGELRGIVSTSALEMGLDIPFFTLGILYGIPNSATSFYQRIGRIGRHKPGLTIIINNGSVVTKTIFRNPDKLLQMPYSESALYLDNPRVQYIHTLCLARQNGENDIINSYLNVFQDKFETEINFPKNFVELCNNEIIGEISPDFQSMKSLANDDPNHTYPLRDIDVQYQVEYKQGPEHRKLGYLSYGQVMREAYPGALYYYQTESFRVLKVHVRKRLIEVRREKKYTTKPTILPVMIFPNFTSDNIYESIKYGNLIFIEANLQIREAISGFKERRGRNEDSVGYPLKNYESVYYEMNRFSRTYFTSGIVFIHPSLSRKSVKCSVLAEIIYESFLLTSPFEKQDISFGEDKHRKERGDYIKENERFIAIFDQTYGSLRLTNRLMHQEIIRNVLTNALDIARNDESFDVDEGTLYALEEIIECLSEPKQAFTLYADKEDTSQEQLVKIILPGSKGLDVTHFNEEFLIESVFYHPTNGLMYQGRRSSQLSRQYDGVKTTVNIKNIVEIPGESNMGNYDYNTGQISGNL